MTLSPVTADNLATPHGFFTRAGGISTGIYAGLNCGAGSHDNPQHVLENRNAVQSFFNAEALCTLYQEHTADVVVIQEAFQKYNRPKADAMVTNRPYIALGILTADCAPVLFYDAVHHVIGAAHAGWKGAIGGVVENTLTAMCQLGAKRSSIHAAIGPCISQESYQVDAAFHAHFLAKDAAAETCFAHDTELSGHYRFDLKSYIEQKLLAAEIENIEVSMHNTYTEEADFFSFRRTTHRGETDYGRHISAIMLQS